MERYLTAGDIGSGDREVPEGRRKGEEDCACFCGAATRNIGIQPFLIILEVDGAPPTYRAEIEGVDPRNGNKITRKMSASEPFSAYIFKTITDPFAGKLTLFKVYSGELH